MHERRPAPAQNVVSQISDGTTVLLQLESGTYFSLDNVGTLIWALCDGRRSVHEIASSVCDEYDIDLSTAADDVDALLAQLEHKHLVSFLDGGTD